MSFLTVSDVKEIPRLIALYPWLKEMYDEAAEISANREEVLSMFSESLRILDRNSMQYMIDEMEEELKQKEETLRGLDGQLQEKDEQLQEKDEQLQRQEEEIARLKMQLAQQEK